MRRIAVVASLGLLAEVGVALGALAPTPAAAAAGAAAVQEKPATAPSTEAPDAASAMLSARLQGHRVEVTGERTETTTLWANPDGTLTQDRSVGPIRKRVGDTWASVDTTLVETADGRVAPKVHPADVVFAGGEAGVTVGDKLPGSAEPPSAATSPTATEPATTSPTATEPASAPAEALHAARAAKRTSGSPAPAACWRRPGPASSST
ncbi:hypothetical protein OG401_04410 [Kitasatospora purpeofusca]|uniref:hypothetical protein n=1 Tax=Kitasatospora purpeofusca TaxID=67352 RepID=UPI0022503CEC|nr:hypothetical protein [Kitasatospora purpeofusca]MCX4683558.1 hypothetical protein [Kitasatospora purpeofusca]